MKSGGSQTTENSASVVENARIGRRLLLAIRTDVECPVVRISQCSAFKNLAEKGGHIRGHQDRAAVTDGECLFRNISRIGILRCRHLVLIALDMLDACGRTGAR